MIWLENADVEHIMDASTGWELHAIRHFAAAFSDLKWTSIVWPKFAARTRYQGTSVAM